MRRSNRGAGRDPAAAGLADAAASDQVESNDDDLGVVRCGLGQGVHDVEETGMHGSSSPP